MVFYSIISCLLCVPLSALKHDEHFYYFVIILTNDIIIFVVLMNCIRWYNFSTISWWEQVTFQWDDDDVRFILGQHSYLDFYSDSSLKQQSADRQVAELGQIILIPNQPLFAISP